MAALSSHGINMTHVEMCLLEGGYLCVYLLPDPLMQVGGVDTIRQ